MIMLHYCHSVYIKYRKTHECLLFINFAGVAPWFGRGWKKRIPEKYITYMLYLLLPFQGIKSPIKGTVSRDFRLLVFTWISNPQVPEYTIRAVSFFFENSRRYSQLKVHHQRRWHRWQKEQIFEKRRVDSVFSRACCCQGTFSRCKSLGFST